LFARLRLLERREAGPDETQRPNARQQKATGDLSRVALRVSRKIWWRFRDSNPGPADYDSVALTD
jgi:hypothetical protein